MVTNEMKKEEALRRMKMLGIFPQTIEEFRKSGKINVSRCGANFWADEEVAEVVRKFEAEYNGLVYYVIESNFEFGRCLSLLFVSEYDIEWPSDREDIKEGYSFAWVENLDCNWCSEFGSIGVLNHWGGLVRVA